MASSNLPPPAWYQDPNDPTKQRYWDGAQWTEQVAPLANSTQAIPADALKAMMAAALAEPTAGASPSTDAAPAPSAGATGGAAAETTRGSSRMIWALAVVAFVVLAAAVVVGFLASRGSDDGSQPVSGTAAPTAPGSAPGGVTPGSVPSSTAKPTGPNGTAGTSATSSPGGTTSTTAAPLGDLHDPTRAGLLAAVRDLWKVNGDRDFAAMYDAHDAACHAKYDLAAYSQYAEKQMQAVEAVLHVKVKNLVVGEIKIGDFTPEKATVIYVDLKNPTTGLVLTDRDSAKPIDWVYEDGRWRSTSC